MGAMVVTVMFWLVALLIVAALVGEFRDAEPVTSHDDSAATPEQADRL